MGKIVAGGLAVLMLASGVILLVVVATVHQILGELVIRPQPAVVVEAWQAAEKCPFTPSTVASSSYLLASAWALTGDGAGLGHYANPWGSAEDIPAPYRDRAREDLKPGASVDRELGLNGRARPEAWTTLLRARQDQGAWHPDAGGERGIGFLLLRPSVWDAWSREVPGVDPTALDPYTPGDAFQVLACHMRHVETATGADVAHAGDTVLQPILTSLGDQAMQLADMAAEAIGRAGQILGRTGAGPGELADRVLGQVLGPVPALGARFWEAVQSALASTNAQTPGDRQPSALARSDIPAPYLALYQQWAARFHVDWTVLAGVGKIETDHGRSSLPGVRSEANASGAAGPMQFEPPTFRAYAVDADGNGAKDLYDPADAVATAGHYLQSLGADQQDRVRAALCHYNAGGGDAFTSCMTNTDPQNSYPEMAMGWAQKYGETPPPAPGGSGVAANLPWPTIPLTLPIRTQKAIPQPAWPSGTDQRAGSPATNQCVAGALWAWAAMHPGDSRWPPNLQDPFAYQMLGSAQRLGYETSPPDKPVVGSMVVYASGWGGPGDAPGHIATVIGVQGDRFEVIEQNLVNSSSVLRGGWGTFDVRIDQAGARGIEGFIVAPR